MKKNKKGNQKNFDVTSLFSGPLSADDFIELSADEFVKLTWSQLPYPGFSVCDISMKYRGGKEETLLLENDFYNKNIRRGLCLLEDPTGTRTIIRKGLPKIPKFNPQIFASKENDQFLIRLSELIVSPVKKALEEGFQIKNFVLSKANGEPCMISFCQPLDCWVVGSRSVSILVKELEDLLNFSESRFNFVKQMTEVWFSILKGMSAEKLSDLIDFCMKHTIIAEFCGNPSNVNLISYNRPCLIFFSAVETNSEEKCLSPGKSLEIFKNLGIPYVNWHEEPQIDSFQAFEDQILQINTKICKSSIDLEGEGAVIYSVKVSNSSGDTVLSISKVQSLEYRIFRKIQEKLKELGSSKYYKKDDYFHTFVTEDILKLCSICQPFKDVSFYTKLALAAREEYLKMDKSKDRNIVSRNFMSFIEGVRTSKLGEDFDKSDLNSFASAMEEKVVSKENFHLVYLLNPNLSESEISKLKGSLTLEKIYSQEEAENEKWVNDSPLAVALTNEVPNFKKNIWLIFFESQIEVEKKWNSNSTFVARKSEEGQDFVDNLVQTIISRFTLMSTGKSRQTERVKPTFSSKKSGQKQNLTDKNKKLIVFIPLGIPAMGKSMCLERMKGVLEYLNVVLLLVSSDQARKRCIDELMEKNKNLTFDECFEKTHAKAKTLFFNELNEAINSVHNYSQETIVLFIDKNHPPNAIESTIKFINDNSPKKTSVKIVAFLPKVKTIFKTKKYEFPFSLNFLLNCLARAIGRKQHETLRGEAEKVVGVVVMFFNFFRGFKFKGFNLTKLNFDYYVELPFTDEDLEIPDLIKEKVKTMIETHKLEKSESVQNMDVRDFIRAFSESKLHFRDIGEEEFDRDFITSFKGLMGLYEGVNIELLAEKMKNYMELNFGKNNLNKSETIQKEEEIKSSI